MFLRVIFAGCVQCSWHAMNYFATTAIEKRVRLRAVEITQDMNRQIEGQKDVPRQEAGNRSID